MSVIKKLFVLILISFIAFMLLQCEKPLSEDDNCDTNPDEDCELVIPTEVTEVDDSRIEIADSDPVKVYFFSQDGCDYCNKLKDTLTNEFEPKTGVKLDITVLNVVDDLKLIEALRQKTGLEITGSPVLVFDDIVLSGKQEINANYQEQLIKTAQKSGDERSDLIKGLETENIQIKLPDIITMISMGLVDGINPCAFATIIFLISYLAYAKRTKRETLIIGIIYTSTVFITYFLVGVLFFNVVKVFINTAGYSIISTIFKIISIGLVLVLLILTVSDFIKALKGNAGDMTLSLSDKMKSRIHKVIRNNLKFKGVVISSIVIGILVSFFELACTGQIYLPAVLHILNADTAGTGIRSTAFLYLLVYNICFIIPLLVIFVLSYVGVSSNALQKYLQKNTAGLKLLMFILFLGLLIYMVLSYFILVP